jgi:uncharacterized integral membrane protein (TIGR00697 family)
MNEFLFFALMLFSFAITLAAARFGREGLIAASVTFTIISSVYFVKIASVFGFVASIGAPIYAGIFLTSKVLADQYGEQAAYRAVKLGYLSLIALVGAGFFVIAARPAADLETASAMDRLFRTLPRIVAGAMIAYPISQSLNVFIFRTIEKLSEGKHLWLRNIAATAVAQGVDTVVFVFIGFWGRMEGIGQFILVYWMLKVTISVFDTPIVYLARRMTPFEE